LIRLAISGVFWHLQPTLHPCFMASLRIPRILSLVGLALVVTGITFKLNHLMGAETVFNAGAVVLVLGLLLWAVALVRAKK
jgi:Flp pilus assembly protein protease CpaA